MKGKKRNKVLLKAILNIEDSVSAFCEIYNFDRNAVGKLIRLKATPLAGEGLTFRFSPICKELAEFLGFSCEKLFPLKLYGIDPDEMPNGRETQNYRLLQAILDMEPSIPMFCRKHGGLHRGLVGELISLNKSPLAENECYRPICEKLAEIIGIGCEELFPLKLYGVKREGKEGMLEAAYLDMVYQPKSPYDAFKETESKKNLLRALATLTPREAEVIRMRFFEDMTLKEIGGTFTPVVTKQNAQQIEARALRKLRHPLRVKILDPYRYEQDIARKMRRTKKQLGPIRIVTESTTLRPREIWPPDRDVGEMSLRRLHLTDALLKRFKDHGLKTVSDLEIRTERELLKIRGVTPRVISKIKKVLGGIGRSLVVDEPLIVKLGIPALYLGISPEIREKLGEDSGQVFNIICLTEGELLKKGLTEEELEQLKIALAKLELKPSNVHIERKGGKMGDSGKKLWSPDQGVDNMDIREMNFPRTIEEPLRAAGINKISELIETPEHELLRIKGFGQMRVGQIRKVLRELRFSPVNPTFKETPLMTRVERGVWELALPNKVKNRVREVLGGTRGDVIDVIRLTEGELLKKGLTEEELEQLKIALAELGLKPNNAHIERRREEKGRNKGELWSLDQGVDNMDIREMNFPRTIEEPLRAAGINKVSKLIKAPKHRLLRINGVGQMRVERIKKDLKKLRQRPFKLSPTGGIPLMAKLEMKVRGLGLPNEVKNKIQEVLGGARGEVIDVIRLTEGELRKKGLTEKELEQLKISLAELELRLRKEE